MFRAPGPSVALACRAISISGIVVIFNQCSVSVTYSEGNKELLPSLETVNQHNFNFVFLSFELNLIGKRHGRLKIECNNEWKSQYAPCCAPLSGDSLI